uniref:hypothetical protein n=1 Tax=Ileibacterium valens TaxID=1862668 RepID=UPI00272D84D3
MRKGFFLDLLNTIGLIILLFTEPRLGRGGWNSTIITFGIFIMVQIERYPMSRTQKRKISLNMD